MIASFFLLPVHQRCADLSMSRYALVPTRRRRALVPTRESGSGTRNRPQWGSALVLVARLRSGAYTGPAGKRWANGAHLVGATTRSREMECAPVASETVILCAEQSGARNSGSVPAYAADLLEYLLGDVSRTAGARSRYHHRCTSRVY